MIWDVLNPSGCTVGQVVAINEEEARELGMVIWKAASVEGCRVRPHPNGCAWLKSICAEHLKAGPKKVLINSFGKSVTKDRAEAMGIDIDLIFIKQDGWSLGCPLYLALTAEACYPHEWAYVITVKDKTITAYQQQRYRQWICQAS